MDEVFVVEVGQSPQYLEADTADHQLQVMDVLLHQGQVQGGDGALGVGGQGWAEGVPGLNSLGGSRRGQCSDTLSWSTQV